MSESRYVVRPKADRDLDDQAFYYATEASPEVGHRFLVAKHETFSLLATQPSMGWHSRLRHNQAGGPSRISCERIHKDAGSLPAPSGRRGILRVVHGSRNLQALFRREGLE